MSFTPGPWVPWGRFGQEITKFWPDGEDDLGGITVIAKVERAEGDRASNAALIAAAPDLYHALASLVATCIESGLVSGDAFSAAVDRAKAALAKAGGEE